MFEKFLKDEDGAVMVEYVIMLAFLVVGFIWLNKAADTLLFGATPYARFGNPTEVEEELLATDYDDRIYQSEDDRDKDLEPLRVRLKLIGGETPSTMAANPQNAYLSQVYIHLGLP